MVRKGRDAQKAAVAARGGNAPPVTVDSKSKQHRADKAKRNELRKGRNDASATGQFRKQLSTIGLRWKDIVGDGNCLFRSVADCLHGDEGLHADARTKCCSELAGSRDEYAPFVLDEEDAGGGDFDKYLHAMREDGAWGGNIEIQAVSKAYRINICVHQVDQPPWLVINWPSTIAKTIHLAYQGGEHYDAVRGVGDADDGPAAAIVLPGSAAGSTDTTSSASRGDHHHLDPCERQVLAAFPAQPPSSQTNSLAQPSLARIREALADCDFDADAAIEVLLQEQQQLKAETATSGIGGIDNAPDTADPVSASAAVSAPSPSPGPAASTEPIEGSTAGESAGAAARHHPRKGKADPPAPRRNGPCPCGSLKLYRKCCESIDKARASREKHGGGSQTDESAVKEGTASLGGLRI